MASRVMIECDWKKLKKEFMKRGLNHNDVAEELGFCRSYFHNCMSRNQISSVASRAIEIRYNIKPEDYKVDVKTFTDAAQTDKTYQVGQEVVHSVFGKGVILSVQGVGDNENARVRFENGEVKMFKCKAAKFQIAEKKNANISIDWQKFSDKLHDAIYNAVREALNA